MNTIPFGPRNEPPDPLLAKAAELPKDVAPARDLWPSIAARIARRAAAGTLAQLRLAGSARRGIPRRLGLGPADLGPDARHRSRGAAACRGHGEPTETAIVPVSYGPNSGLTAKEIVARDELLARFREKFDELKPETRVAIQKNIAIIQAAANEIDAALAKDPASGMLKSLLVGAYKQELQLYSTVVTSSDGLMRRT